MIKVTIHDELLPDGVTSEDIAQAIEIKELPDRRLTVLEMQVASLKAENARLRERMQIAINWLEGVDDSSARDASKLLHDGVTPSEFIEVAPGITQKEAFALLDALERGNAPKPDSPKVEE